MDHLSLKTATAADAYALDNSARAMGASPIYRILFFLLGNMLLAIVVNESSLVATAHALGTFGLGLFFLVRDVSPVRVTYVAAYIVGAELLWRGGNALVFWEFGKYAVAGLMILSMFRHQKLLRSAKVPIVFFLMLLPSIFILPAFNREDISFNMSGAFVLAVATMYFSTMTLTRLQVKRVLLMLLAPAAGLAMLSNFVILSAERLYFVPGSKATSAGIGPNQVASVLALGVLVAFLYAILEDRSRFLRWMLILTVVWLLGQTALTLSRGGVWTAVGSLAVGAFFLLRDRRTRGVLVGAMAIVVFLSAVVVGPFLDSFSQGVVTRRVWDDDLTGRDRIMQADLIAFQRNPVFGLGPGQSYAFHALTFRGSSAHTEYTRLLAEHGSFGLAALLIMIFMGLHNGLFIRSRSRTMRAFAVACIAWTFLYMFHSAMRLAAPSFLFGLAAVTFLDAGDGADDDPI